MAKKANTKVCKNCNARLTTNKFVKGYDKDGKCFWCNSCRKKIKSLDELKDYCKDTLRTFSLDLWNICIGLAEQKTDNEKDIIKKAISLYFSKMNLKFSGGMPVYEDSNNKLDELKNTTYEFDFNKDFEVTKEMIERWGSGFSTEEYYSFEKKYHMLKNNYPERTSMHTEALLIYIRYRVKEELATAKGNVKEAKEWGQLAAKQAQDAKINPSQLSKSDLSDGLDTFSQLVRSVEQIVDIISILPKFKEKPQDKVDFTIWCYINYIRDMKGLPLCEYEDVYQFYEERKKEYENRFDFLKEDDNDG